MSKTRVRNTMFVMAVLMLVPALFGQALASGRQSAKRFTWAKQFFEEFSTKLDQVRNLDEDNDALRQRVAVLELERAKFEFESTSCREGVRSDRIKREARREGGVEEARTIASLKLADEGLLAQPPRKIFEDAVKTMIKGDYETAAKAYAFLVEHPENDSFHDTKTFYLAGFALYKVGNYKRAIGYLREAAAKAVGHDLSYAPRAMAWIVLCYNKMGDRLAERRAAHELIQKFPKSREARRLNRNA